MAEAGRVRPVDGAGGLRSVTDDEFDSCFDQFRFSAVRLETLQAYSVPSERAALAAWRDGQPRPQRSVRTSPWLARMAIRSIAGIVFARIRIVGYPLTDYVRYQLDSYAESAACGELIAVADRAADPALDALTRDFWLFDSGTTGAFAVLMTYDAAGTPVRTEPTTDPAVLRRCQRQLDLARGHAQPLNAFLARRLAPR
jgi:hypothetical protein